MKTEDFYKQMWGDINESLIFKEPKEQDVPMQYSKDQNTSFKVDPDTILRPSDKISDEDDEFLASLLGGKG